MNRRTIYIILIIAAILVMLAGLLIYANHKRGRHWNWSAGYENSGRYKNHPYGMGKLINLFSNRTGKGNLVSLNKSVQHSFNDKNLDGVYVCIGYYPYYSPEDIASLVNFISRGNTAFIAANDLPEELIEVIGITTEDSLWQGFLNLDSKKVSTTLPKLDPDNTYHFSYRISDSLVPFSWRYFNPVEFDAGKIDGTSLGMLENSYDCFYEINLGDGKLLIHTNPIFFSNYYIITDKGYRYASKVFSFISPDMNIYFDRYSTNYPYNSQSEINPMVDSWLSFIIKSPGLQWAWAVLLLAALLFLVFRSRRRQSPMPVVEPNLNSSMEYMQSIATIYLKEKDYRSIALQMKQLFMLHLSIHHKIRMNIPENELINSVTARTAVPENVISQIFTTAHKIEDAKSINKKSLIQWYNVLQTYYSYNK